MPMRGRYIKSEYWEDAVLFQQMSAEERETYIGFWASADDAGWLRWNRSELGAAIYRYAPVREREALVERVLRHLMRLNKAKKHRCGHVQLTSMAKHARSGRPNYDVRDAHAHCLRREQIKAIQKDSNGRISPTTTELNSTDTQLRAPAREEWKELGERFGSGRKH